MLGGGFGNKGTIGLGFGRGSCGRGAGRVLDADNETIVTPIGADD